MMKQGLNKSLYLTKSIARAVAVFALVFVLLFGAALTAGEADAAEGNRGTVVIEALNVRSGAGTLNEAIGMVYMGDTVDILGSQSDYTGTLWYQISYNGGIGYVSSDYVMIKSSNVYQYDPVFEAELDAQGFPESYKDYLRQLHADYPNWVFQAAHTGLDWTAAVNAESGPGVTLVTGTAPSSWKSMEEGAYDFATGKYKQFDSGNWVTASRAIIEHYMDPRNFLTAETIFQFMAHSFDGLTQTADGLQGVLNGTFMAGNLVDSDSLTYNQVLMEAGRNNDVNPYVLASMILVEQGSTGIGKSVSGTVSGYEGYYNYFNVGAYRANGMDAVTRGLWYASQSGSYGRPWDSVAKAIDGGAAFYSANYVQCRQHTLYLKKWNVLNGAEKVGKGQYMTNVQGAESEAAALCRGYLSVMDQAMTFIIPVYSGMPDSACLKPVSSANNNNYLASLTVSGEGVSAISPAFSSYLTGYSLEVPASAGTVYIQAEAADSSASVTGGGLITLEKGAGMQTVNITVTAASGAKKTYSVNITRTSEDPDGSIRAAVEAGEIKASSLQTGNSKIRLTWNLTADTEIDYFEVYRSLKKNSGYGTKPYYTTKTAGSNMYVNSKDLKIGTTYYFKVRGVRMIDGEKVYTQPSNKTWKTMKTYNGPAFLATKTLQGIQKSTVELKAGLNSSGKARLDWEKSEGFKVDYYEVYRADVKTGSGEPSDEDFGEEPYYKTSSGTKKYYVNSKSLKDGYTIYYKVRGVRADGTGKAYTQWSNAASVVIGQPAELPEGSDVPEGTVTEPPVLDDSVMDDPDMPAVPESEDPDGSLKAAVEALTIDLKSGINDKGKVRLDWTLVQSSSSETAVDYYEVYRSTERNKGYGTSPYFTNSGADKTYYINSKGLESGTTYYYKVRGVRLIDGVKVYTQYSNKSWRTIK